MDQFSLSIPGGLIASPSTSAASPAPEAPESLLERIREHHHHARIRLGCSAQVFPSGSFLARGSRPHSSSRPTGEISSVSDPFVLYLHESLPWHYFNHAAICHRQAMARVQIGREIGRAMMNAGRPGCIELEVSHLPETLPTLHNKELPLLADSEWWKETSQAWTNDLAQAGYTPCDDLLVMARFLQAPSETEGQGDTERPGKGEKERGGAQYQKLLARGPVGNRSTSVRDLLNSCWIKKDYAPLEYSIIDMPRRAITRQAAVHREGFEAFNRPSKTEKLLIRTNLDGGVHYLWAMHSGCKHPIGSAAVLVAGDVAELFALSVVPLHRHQGLGSLLVSAAVRYASVRGCTLLYLEAEPGSRAADLYRRMEFLPLWRRVCFLL